MAKKQIITFGAFAAVALVCAGILSVLPVKYPHPSQAESLKMISLIPVLALGALGVLLLTAARAKSTVVKTNAKRQLAEPLLLGVGFGLVAVVLDVSLRISAAMAAVLGVNDIHVALPYSLLAYTAGGIVVESLFRLFPIGLLTFLVSMLVTRGRWLPKVFAGAAIVSCVLEPLTQAGVLRGNPTVMVAVILLVFSFGLVSSWQLWRNGVAAVFAMRLSYYAVWHVILGPFVASIA